MARGNGILVTTEPKGVFSEGFIAAAQTPLPGSIMQIDPTQPLRGGRFTYKLAVPGASGRTPAGPLFVLLDDPDQGRVASFAYAAGERCFLYCPAEGEEINVLVNNSVGSQAAGTVMEVENSTGQLIVASGPPASSPFMILEALSSPAAPTLTWSIYNGR